MTADGLWPHQIAGIEQTRDAFRSHRRVLLTVATGGGKTRTASWIIRAHLARPLASVLFLVHRTELVRQTVATLIRDGLDAANVRVLAGDETEGREDAPMVVASVQTLLARGIRPTSTLVIADEAHHYSAPEWRQVLDHYSAARILGLTATPECAGEPMGAMFDVIVSPTSVRELTAAGFLVPAIIYAPPEKQKGLAKAPADALLERRSEWTRAVVFCANVAHAEATAVACNAAGLRAGCVHGESDIDDRAGVLAEFRAGRLDVVTNVFVLTEGYDDTGIDALVIARGCSSAGTFLQMIGRVIRAHPGKSSAIVLDLQGAVHEHGMPDEPRTYSLEGEAIRQQTGGDPMPVRQCLTCGCAYRAGPAACPRCGAKVPPPPKPKIKPAELARIMDAHPVDKRIAVLRGLIQRARAAGYKPGWVGMQFKVRYGHFPSSAMLAQAGGPS